ncbi:MAG: InlB B-repeat-containing protein [Firmicutes bacterium]|nr:InlB B-repeat-containing protein [Bacillota bacterium]
MKLRKIVLLLAFVLLLVSCTPKESEKTSFTVTFEVAGGSLVTEQSVVDGEKAIEPEDPTRITYLFDGWYTDLNLTSLFDFETPITGNIKLYAKWSADVALQTAYMDADAAAISLADTPVTASKLNLPIKGTVNDSGITWSSSNPAIINRHGVVFHPTMGEDDVTVTLTAKLTYGLQQKFFDFEVVVPAKTDVIIDDSVELPFTNLTSEFTVADANLTTYFAEDGALPYVDFMEFLSILEGFLYFDDFEFTINGDSVTVYYQAEYDIEDDQGNVTGTETEDFYLTIDFEENTVTMDTLSFFEGYIYETATDYGAGITYLETYYEEGESVTLELTPYRFDLVIHQDGLETKYLFPFHIANLLFTGGSYYNVYYNGNGYSGIYAFPDTDDATGETEDGRAYNAIKVSSLNGTDISPDVLVATYDLLVFSLDYFFGLKSQRGIDTYYNTLTSTRDSYMTGKTRDLSNGIFNVVNKTLDDLHSSYHFPGYYEVPSFKLALETVAQVGPTVRSWYDVLFDVQDLFATTYPQNADNIPPDYRFIDGGKTAVIYLDGFYTATVEDPDGDDSHRFMRETMDAIMLENRNVENIVVDLSFNTGGNLGALIRVLGFMTEQPIEMSYMNPTDKSNVTYFADVDTVAYTDVNWFFITSRVTFSAANLMTSIGQHMGFATIIGTKSGGGASSIIPVVLPDGTFFHMSSLNVLSYRVGNEVDGYEYFSIEDGITPDYVLPVADTQNSAKIIEVIELALADE